MSNLKLSAFSDEYADSAVEQLGALKQFGFDYMEVRHLDGKNISVMDKAEVLAMKKQLDEAGIRVSGIGSPLGKIRLDEDMGAHLEVAKRVFEYANILQTPYVRMFSFYAPEGKDITTMKSEVLAAIEKLVVLAREYGVTLCHENEAEIYGAVPSRCREILDHFHGELKCIYDMGNFVLEGVDPFPDSYELLREYIAYFHIKDALYEGAIVPAGFGNAKIKEILDAHKNYAKDDFFITLEPHLQTFSGLNALVGRSFTNPYQYEDSKASFADAVEKLRALI